VKLQAIYIFSHDDAIIKTIVSRGGSDMFHFSSKRKNAVVTEQVEHLNQKLDENQLGRSLDTNVQIVKKLFTDVDILIVRYFQNNHDKNLKYCIVYCDGVVNSEIINENIIKPLMLSDAASGHPDGHLVDDLVENVVFINEIKKTKEMKEIVEAVTYGDTILFVEGGE